MAYYVIFTKVVTLTLTFIRFKKVNMLQGPMNMTTSVWPVHPVKTNQEDRTGQFDLYTLLRR